MENQEHLDILKRGVEVWNKWREEHSEIQPQINGASLNGVNLSEINIQKYSRKLTERASMESTLAKLTLAEAI